MDELPRDAKALVAVARTADEAPEGARDRVRRGVAVMLATGVAASTGQAAASTTSSASSGALKGGFLSTAYGKLALVGAAVVLIGAAALMRPRSAPIPQRIPQRADVSAQRTLPTVHAASEAKPALVEPPSLAAPVLGDDGRRPAGHAAQVPVAHARKSQKVQLGTADEGLRAEMTILQEASAALDRGELAQARSLLKTHRAQHPQGQLQEERQGLDALARCMANDAGAERSARSYLRSAPQGVLSARIARACIEQEPPQGAR